MPLTNLKLQFHILLLLVSVNVFGQSVNEKIVIRLIQPNLLRVEAGNDINLTETGSVILGESLYVTGGTPEFSYVWTDESGNDYNEQYPEVSNTGKYRLDVTDQVNCSASDSLTVNDYGTRTVWQEKREPVKVFFDDSRKIMVVEISEFKGTGHLSIFNMEGKVFYSQDIEIISNVIMHQIDLSNLNSGIYLFQILNEDKRAVLKFLVE